MGLLTSHHPCEDPRIGYGFARLVFLSPLFACRGRIGWRLKVPGDNLSQHGLPDNIGVNRNQLKRSLAKPVAPSPIATEGYAAIQYANSPAR